MFAHIDADAFFASVLQRQNPKLIGKPLLALGMGGGCVIAASYEAKAKGVRTGMRVTEAQKLCPGAVAIPSDFTDACRASQQIESIIEDMCPVIEKYSVDEWFLDLRTCVGGTPKEIDAWGHEIQCKIHKSVGLSVSIGVGPTKLITKMASEYRKPAGMTIVHSQTSKKLPYIDREAFLRDRPVEAIPGIGRARSIHTKAFNLKSAWDFTVENQNTIVHLFGKPGKELQEELRGNPVHTITTNPPPPKSISRARSFRKTDNTDFAYAILMQHVSYCILRMRTKGLSAKWLSVWVRDGDYKYAGDGRRLPQNLQNEEQLLPYIRSCFDRSRKDKAIFTQVGLSLSDLTPKAPLQYSLFEEAKKQNSKEDIQEALDTIRTKYGRGIITRGSGILASSKQKEEPNLYGNAVIGS